MKKNVLLSPRYAYAFIVCFVMHCVPLAAQPRLVGVIPTGSRNFVTVNGSLYYSAGDSLFTSDGTSASTRFVKEMGEPIYHISNVSLGEHIFFVTRNGGVQSLWRTDGTAANTVKLATHNSIWPLLVYNSQLYLTIHDESTGQELWKLNGNTTQLVKDINAGPSNGFYHNLVISNGLLYFYANAGTTGKDLWKSDGTTAGTVLAVNLDDSKTGYWGYFYNLIDIGGVMFMARTWENQENGDLNAELWKTSGSPETTTLIKDLEGSSWAYNDLSHFLNYKGKLYFIQNEGIPSHHLWVSDGTAAGTQMIKRNASIDGAIYEMENAADYFVYLGASQGYTNPIVKSDGVAFEQIHMFSNYFTGGPDVVNLTPTDSLLFFVDYPKNEYGDGVGGVELYQSDLASGNTKTLKELYNMSFSGSDNVVAVGKAVFFTSNRTQGQLNLWYYDPDAPSACVGTGEILREFWTGISGNTVSTIPVNTIPSGTQTLASFEGPSNIGDNYGSRYKGYLCIPQTGAYRFWIASNDNSELWLSSSMDPAKKVKIASVTGYTNPRQYDKYATQQSALINLVAGQLYYIEALHKEGVGTDHVSVGMQLPDGTLERPIPGSRLILFNNPPVVTITSPKEGESFAMGTPVTITANAIDSDGTITKVEFYSYGRKLGEDATSPYSFVWNDVPSGSASVQAKATDNRGVETWSDYRNFYMVDACANRGSIVREVWNYVSGYAISNIPLHATPSSAHLITNFEAPSNQGDNYGARVRGYFCPPASGNYVFWISSDDNSELWLSTDANPANKRLIASSNWTLPNQWNKYPKQQSAPITLTAGTKYYIEALHKEAAGNDHLAVGMTLPDGTLERPIQGSRLIPFYRPNERPTVTIIRPTQGEQFSPPATITIEATASDPEDGNVNRVEFYNGTTKLGEDYFAPYIFQWNNVPTGNYTIWVKAYDTSNQVDSEYVEITVTGACTAIGHINREYWFGIPGTDVASIPVNNPPQYITTHTSFETGQYFANDYGSRMRGYVCVPETGNYTFWVASDDNSQLWLSTDENPANKRMIASVTGATLLKAWDKYPSQRSALISLIGGKRYYIEVLHKEGGGNDHIAVGWQLPGGTLERPISGSRLSPFDASSSPSMTAASSSTEMMMMTESENDAAVELSPNPIVRGPLTITLSGEVIHEADQDLMHPENSAISVEVVSMMGKVLYTGSLPCDGNCDKVNLDITEKFTPGMYIVNGVFNGKRFSKRLIVN